MKNIKRSIVDRNGLLSLLVITSVTLFKPFGVNAAATAATLPDTEVAALDLGKSRQDAIERTLKIAERDVIRLLEAPPRRRLLVMFPDLYQAIQMLGNYRAVEAVNFLIRNVSLRSGATQYDYTPLGDFSCVHALIKIGNPSIAGILRRLSPVGNVVDPNLLNEQDLHLFAYIIREIDGHEVGLFRLEEALKGASGANQQNLLKLIEIYKRKESGFDINRVLLTEQPPRN